VTTYTSKEAINEPADPDYSPSMELTQRIREDGLAARAGNVAEL
jgi:hypothetical protein